LAQISGPHFDSPATRVGASQNPVSAASKINHLTGNVKAQEGTLSSSVAKGYIRCLSLNVISLRPSVALFSPFQGCFRRSQRVSVDSLVRLWDNIPSTKHRSRCQRGERLPRPGSQPVKALTKVAIPRDQANRQK
jgi:hypothetical protein